MRVLFGTTQVPTATTRVQLRNTYDEVVRIQFKARRANTGRIFVGLVDVSLTVNGWELEIPIADVHRQELSLDFSPGSVKMNLFYADATVDNDRLDWVAILK